MTHRQARRRLGSRSSRRTNTKTKVIPGGLKGSVKGKQPRPPKYRLRRASKGMAKLAVRVRRLVEASGVRDERG